MKFDTITDILGELAVLKYFPADPIARTAIVRLVGEMAESEDQVRWLVRRMTSGLYNEWPGPRELRACFCSRFKPRDGISICSEVYRDGIPSEKPPAQLALPSPRSREISASPSLQRAVAMLADAKGLEAPRKRVATPEIPVVRLTAANSVTQLDIDRAVQANRDARAKAELGEGA